MSTLPNQHRHIIFIDPPNPDNLEIDYDLFDGEKMCIHTKVYWKTECVVIIKKVVKHGIAKRVADRSFDDDDDEEDQQEAVRSDKKREKEYFVHSNWDWLVAFYGDFDTIEEARIGAHAAVLKIMDQIRWAFMLKAAPAPAPEPTGE